MGELCELVEELCAFNSHTFNAAGVDRAGEITGRELTAMGFEVEPARVEPASVIGRDGRVQERELGRAVRAVWHPGAARRALLCIHLDTVHLPESGFSTRREGDRLVGPGVVDAKGGLVVMLEGARRFIGREGMAAGLGLEVLVTPDEEIGSGSSVGLLKESAGRCVAGLVYEPSFPDGALVGARKGSGTYVIVVRGREAHAGRDFAVGRNAAVAAARCIAALDAINGAVAGVTVNVGVVEAGSAANVVPGVAVVRANVRVEGGADVAMLDAAVWAAAQEAEGYRDGISAEVQGGLTSPPRAVDARNRRLFEWAVEAGSEAGLELKMRDSGGTCDGNKLAAYGLGVIDSLGPVGGELHTEREYVVVPSLEERAELTARVLSKLAAEGRAG